MAEPISRIPFYEVGSSVMTAGDMPKFSWGVGYLGVDKLHAKTRGEGAIGAVLDTGIDSSHHDLVNSVIGVKSFVPNEGPQDGQGHGTHCAGIIASNGHMEGIAPDCKLIGLKVLDSRGSGRNSWIINALNFIANGDAGPIDFVSMSLGSPQNDPKLLEALMRLGDQGIISIVAAGNEGRPDSVDFPGMYSLFTASIITVASINKRGLISDYSSRGPAVSICAPGEDIVSTIPGDRYVSMSGTSMATPCAAGCLALIISAWKKANGNVKLDMPAIIKARDAMIRTAIDVDQKGFDKNAGWGLVNPTDALNYMPPVIPTPEPGRSQPQVGFPLIGPVNVNVPAAAGDKISFNW